MPDEIIYKTSIKKAERNNSHSLAREFVNDCGSALSVLEVGCASGYFGLALQEDGHRVKGIEPYAPAASEAIAAGLDVLTGTFDDYCTQYPNNKVDVITFGDVLEHLVDPGAALKACLQHLNPGGSVVCSIPNVAHISVRALLLEGRWEYKKTGILDETHLRFFCRDQFEHLVSSVGLKVESSQAVRLTAKQADKMFDLKLSDRMVDAVEKLGSNDPSLEIFQYVYRLRPSNESKRPSINIPGSIWVVSDNPNGNHLDVRIRRALNQLERLTVTSINYYSYAQLKNRPLQGVDVVIFQRPYTDSHFKAVDRVHQEEIPYVYELDDLITAPPDYSEAADTMRAAKSKILRMMANASLVTVSTENLASELNGACKHISVISNAPTCPPISQHIRYNPSKPISLVVASSDTVPIEVVAAAINKLKTVHPNGFAVHTIGPVGNNLNKILRVPAKQHTILQRDEFISLITSLDNAIVLIPLDEGRFNACKSSIKFLDCAAAGIVVLASNVAPYKDIDLKKVSGLLLDNHVNSWFAALDELVREPARLLQLQPTESMRGTLRTPEDMALDWAQALGSITSRAQLAPTVLVVDRGTLLIPPMRQVVKKLLGGFREMNRKRVQKRRSKKTRGV